MGVTHGKKRDLQHSPETHLNRSAMQTRHTEQQGQHSELQAPPSPSEEESPNLIRPQKPPNPLAASRSHQELHRELRITHKRRVTQEGKTELQRALEKRRWDQRVKASRDQEEKNRSPLHQELLKRHQRLEELERDHVQQREGPEFLQVKERLRRTVMLEENAAGKEV